ncbi:GAF domain-containing protein [Baaleninema sp.]|uniref:GAF domain-containing protein n=1 Tax=Baaleninema sp. TaxID=3101197 RepID=UPI003D003DC9
MNNYLCPSCSYPLLCYVRGGKPYWFCPRCHQEVPYGLNDTARFSMGSEERLSRGALASNRFDRGEFQVQTVRVSPLEGTNSSTWELTKNLNKILKEILLGLRKILRVDRVLVCQTRRDREAVVVAESLAPGRKSMLKCRLGRFFASEEITQFHLSKVQAIEDLSSVDIDRCPTKILECFFEVSAKLVVPILLPVTEERPTPQLWGLLMAHQCFTPHRWTQAQIDTMVLLGKQLAGDIDREQRYQALEAAHHHLEELTCIRDLDPFPVRQEMESSAAEVLEPEALSEPVLLPRRSPAIEASPMAVLKSYVAYYLSRGKAILSPVFEVPRFHGITYSYDGYHLDFESFWGWLQQRPDFLQLYLEGDLRCFGHFLEGRYTVSECQRCHLPIPASYGVAYDAPECALCDEECPVKAQESGREFPMTNVISVGDAPSNSWEIDRFFEKNCFDVTFVEEPAEILAQRILKKIDVVIIRSSLSETEGVNWAEELRQHPRLVKTPIVALSDRAGDGLPWVEHSLDLEDYLLPPLNGEHLVRHLKRHRRSHKCLLHWFPR